MTTTGHPPRTPDSGITPRRSTSVLAHQRQIMQRYLAAVDEAKRHEAHALAKMRSDLAALDQQIGGAPTVDHAADFQTPYEPRQRTRNQRSDWRDRNSRRRLVAIAALLLVVFIGWKALASDDSPEANATASKANPHAGHNMSGGSQQTVKLAPDGNIDVTLGEFYVMPNYGKARSGQITFNVKNNGKAEHELMIANVDDLSKDEIESMSSAEVHQLVLGSAHGVTPGSSDKSISLDLEPGKYILFCNLPGHFGQGQSTVFRVA